MSRFFRAGSSESESEESEEEEIVQRPKAAAPASRVFQFSDDEDDTKRVVRSAKDKRFEVLQNAIKHMRNSMKINDIVKILTEYENLTRGYDKAKAVVVKEGIPNFYIKILSDLEDYVQAQWEDTDGRKKLSKLNAKALATLRQKQKKYNRDFEERIADCKANPAKYEEMEEEVEEDAASDSDDGFQPVKKEKQKAKAKALEEDEESDDDAWWENEDDSSSSDDDDIPAGGARELTAAFFLKKVDTGEKEKKEKKIRLKKEPRESKKKDANEWTEIKAGGATKSRLTFPKDTEFNHQVILKKFHEILAVRGKKGTDRSEQIDYFTELKSISEEHELGDALSLKLLFNIAAAIFDSAGGTDVPLKPEMWQRLVATVEEVVTVVRRNPDMVYGESISEENVEDSTIPYRIQDNPVMLLERMDDEFTKILQNCDGHSTEYIGKLKDENSVVRLIDLLQDHLERYDFPQEELCRVYLRRIEHTYYKLDVKELRSIRDQIKTTEEKRNVAESKAEAAEVKTEDNATKTDKVATKTDEVADAVKSEDSTPATESTETTEDGGTSAEVAAAPAAPVEEESKPECDDRALLDKLCKYIYAMASDRIRTRTMLCQIYHHALHDRWYQARDLMLISHLQETIQHSDIPTQILYNRTIVQLGLCAFRHGMIYEAHNSLHDVQATGRAKEMLAQGLMNLKNTERTPEQEKIEKRRMMPFHMHINLELLECVYLTSAMLLEIPFMASHEFDYRRKMISKSFHYQLRVSDRQPLIGPPESMREHVVAASKAMKTGDWRKCNRLILAVSCWDLFPNAATVKTMITRKIQEESLRTYLFTYNKIYDSISMHSLAEMFELPSQVVHSTISKMIIYEELQASWDEPTQTLVLHHGAEPTYLQSLTLQLSDKINSLVEHHERILEFKYGREFTRGPQNQQRNQNSGRGRGGGRFGGNRRGGAQQQYS